MEEKKLVQSQNIVKDSGGTLVLKGINLDIYESEFVTLLGPSRCGKTTLLRILGGSLNQNEGHVIFDGEDITDVPPYKRELNTVFRKYALFPHMNVYDNIAFGLKVKKMSKDIIEQKVLKMLKLIDLEGYEKKDVILLSEGQQQHIVTARALANEPKVLLLDELLGALDLKLRKEMQYELKKIRQEVGITFTYVTHDQKEALTTSDKIVVMKDGKIQQVGAPTDIYNEPENRYAANFIGENNITPGIILDNYKVVFDDISFDCVDFGFKKNEKVNVVIRPKDLDIVKEEDGKMTGIVKSVLFKGVHYEIMVEAAPGTAVSVMTNVTEEHNVSSSDTEERISANDFYVDIEDVKELNDAEIIARADAQAWSLQDDEYISINKIECDIPGKIGTYPVTFSTSSGTSVSIRVFMVQQKYMENPKADEAVSASNFFKTVDELKENAAIDTDLKTWANVQSWKLSDESDVEIPDVDYDFDPDNTTAGTYQVTFSTQGREFKVHTTDIAEEGAEVGSNSYPEDIHVMSRMGY